MVIYVNKSGTDLNVGVVEEGAEPNGFEYVGAPTPYIEGYFHRRNDWNNYYFMMGTSLNETNSFFAKFMFELPAATAEDGRYLY